jgi:alpha-ketoglutaric semialdehyde dehydrogenase
MFFGTQLYLKERGMNFFPEKIPNIIGGEEKPPSVHQYLDNINPHDGSLINKYARSTEQDLIESVQIAKKAQIEWSAFTPVKRGQILYDLCDKIKENQNEIAQIVATETGKSMKMALEETGGAMALGQFFAGEGQRLFGRTLPSGVPNKSVMTVREPVGIAGLIVPANTPIANVAWKIFPALICGNAVILKSSEDAPGTSWIIGKLASEVGLPAGILNVLHGLGNEIGEPLIKHPDIGVISFTGSTQVGKRIASIAGERLAKVSLELGGKNPLVVCDDADLDNALNWVLLAAFSNAGQRCASGSRIIIMEKVYDEFKRMLLEATQKLVMGIGDNDDLGPVINERQLKNMLSAVSAAQQRGAAILIGGERSKAPEHKNGYYMCPSILENISSEDEISQCELFGPITILYQVKTYEQALNMANNSDYGLTSAIHTTNVNRAFHFAQNVKAGISVVNGGTFGSEPHMPFGGQKMSGNGTREPGTEALDVYSELKAIHFNILHGKLN